jgi:D-alanyl-D-alanine dipeptidase
MKKVRLSNCPVLIISRKIRLALALVLLPLGLFAQPAEPVLGLLAMSRQMVVVTTQDWNAASGSMQRYEFDGAQWQPVGPPLPAVLGSNGLGWGVGLHPARLPGPRKQDGDGRSPAGIFRLPYCFGYAPPEAVRAVRLPYVQCTDSVECVEDTNSDYYNIVKDRLSAAKVDWKKSEKMWRDDGEYRLGVFVENNSEPVEPGAGSCVFLHIWKGPGVPTNGGTAMSAGAIESLVGWLDPRSTPVLVQLPLETYRFYQPKWRLPPAPLPAGASSGAKSP